MRRHLTLVLALLAAAAVPLSTAVGANLEYEYALAAALAFLALAPLVAAAVPRSWLPAGDDGRFQISIPWQVLWVFAGAPVLAVLAASSMFAFGHCPCSKTGFLFWMAVLFYPASVLAHALHFLVVRLRLFGASRRIAAFFVVAVLAGGVLLSGLELWTQPQKRIVSLFLGFLHGPIYDDWIPMDRGIALVRGAQLCLASALFILALWRGQKTAAFFTVLFVCGWIGLGQVAQQEASAGGGKAALDALLDGKLEGDGFTMRFKGVKTGKPPLGIRRLFRDTEFHVAELKTLFQEPTLPHVTIYVYPSDDQKKLWFGGGSTDVTDVYTPSVHISSGSWPHPTLRHELVHALASGIAYHGLGFHPNMAFTEGLAVALAPSATTLSLDDGTASLLDTPRLPDVAELFSPMFWKVSGSRAYTAAGSLIRHLVRKHGMAGVKALYAGSSWEAAFKQDRDTIINEWKDGIRRGYDKERNALFSEALFRYPGVFADECPHGKADLLRGRDDVFVRMRQPPAWDPDTDYLPWLLQIDPKDKEIVVRVWRRDLAVLAGDRVASPGRFATWRETLARGRKSPPEALEDVEVAVMESDLARIMGDVSGSKKILEELAAFGKTKYFGESSRREIEARLALEGSFPEAEALAWRRYLATWGKIPARREGEPWVASYLRLRNGQFDELGRDGLVKLAAQPADPAMSSSFHFEWWKFLATKLMREDAFAEAATVFAKAAEVTPTAARELYEEHARRARFYAEKGAVAR